MEVERIELSSGSRLRRNLHTYPLRLSFRPHPVAEAAKNRVQTMSEEFRFPVLTCAGSLACKVGARHPSHRRWRSERV